MMLRSHPAVSVGFLLTLSALRLKADPPVVLTFDELPGMSYLTGTNVPSRAMLSDQYLATAGVIFRSQNRPFVAVANLSSDSQSAPSPPNAIGGVTAGNKLDYAVPIFAEFFQPQEASTAALTDFVSVTLDSSGDGQPVVITAFDVEGTPLKSVTRNDTDGPVLQLSIPGIHSIRLMGAFGTSYDDFTFNRVLAAPLFRRGDATGDGVLNISDPIEILSCLFLGTECSACDDAADSDDDGFITITDAIGLLGYLYLGTIAPPPPFAECGSDATKDPLGCGAFKPCSSL